MTANALTGNILVAVCEAYYPNCFLFRVNVIAARTKTRMVRSAPVGTADLIGVIKGIPVAIEVKAGRDRQTPAQVLFETQWFKAGGLYVTARTVEQAMEEIEAGVMAYAK